jgi:hypothetical protein
MSGFEEVQQCPPAVHAGLGAGSNIVIYLKIPLSSQQTS